MDSNDIETLKSIIAVDELICDKITNGTFTGELAQSLDCAHNELQDLFDCTVDMLRPRPTI